MPEAQQATTTRTLVGRRHRPTYGSSSSTTSSSSNSVTDAKTKFVESVSRGVSILMEERGYSRERATTALMREIARGDLSPPKDEEVSH